MHPAEFYIKETIANGKLTADFYNDHVLSAFESGLIKDVTPKEIKGKSLPRFRVVHAWIEFSSGEIYEIVIDNPTDFMNPDNRYNYKYEVRKVLVTSKGN